MRVLLAGAPVALRSSPIAICAALALTGVEQFAGQALVSNWSRGWLNTIYTPGVGGVGYPVIRVCGSLAAPDVDPTTLTADDWIPLTNLDNTSYATGAIDQWPESIAQRPTPPAPLTRALRSFPYDTSGWNWLALYALDTDAAQPGTLDAYLVGVADG